jgi:hypothetical protein
MARDTKWCQNPKCPEKKNSNQIRGIKGSKYYQSNRANGYGNGNFCTLGCYDEWSNIYLDRAIDTIGVRITEPVKVGMENAWLIDAEYQYSSGYGDSHWLYFLVNKLYNVRHPITKQQASIHPNEEYSPRLTSAQAKVLAEQLGLTSQQ